MKRLILILCLLAAPAWAIDPSDMLADPVLEARARVLDLELRCVKCQSEAIASSNAEWARDARLMVRELLVDGVSDQGVKDFFHARYGDFVLMDPPKSGANLILWIAGPLMLFGALGVGAMYLRRRGQEGIPDALSDQEKARLDELLRG
ncbi:MAG: cytochrome c-type biogenesis protein [Paracoccaceae bacterium]